MPSLFPQSGPSLPPFRSLLVTGDYHPSAPIHLCLSSISEIAGPSKTILISSSRQSLKATLQHYNDDWLESNSGHGSTISLSSRIQLFYPPSPAHLCYLLSMLTVSRSPGHLEAGAWLNTQTTFTVAPSLIILHEPSAYFLTTECSLVSSKLTISSYLSLVAHVLSCASFLTNNAQSRGVSVALFDSRLEQLRLPMMKAPTSRHIDDDDNPRLEHVYVFVKKYFEWHIVSNEEVTPSTWNHRRKRSMALHHTSGNKELVRFWTWWEGPDDSVERDKPTTHLFWDR